jgi:hypothetical protein
MNENCLIWSFEHGGWWRPGALGYTEGFADFEQAARYTLEQAQAICANANLVGINEAIVPLDEHTLDGERARRKRGD